MMGWFWADAPALTAESYPRTSPLTETSPPPACPMRKPSPPPVKQSSPRSSTSEGCPYTPPTSGRDGATQQSSSIPAQTPSSTQRSSPNSTVAALNPLNYMFSDLSQQRESSSQSIKLPVERETSSIPRGGSGAESGNWVYPSPQQMYNALVRKGHTDTPEDAVESMVAVHNFLNEGAWAEIVEWERRFSKGIAQGWKECQFGEDGSQTGAMILPDQKHSEWEPKLVRFMGRSHEITPKARMLQVMGWLHPEKYGGPPPFDRHDWFVERQIGGGRAKEIRYVIDYYSAPPEATGEPVFYLDIRPALDRPEAVAERSVRWARDLWWRASGASVRLQKKQLEK